LLSSTGRSCRKALRELPEKARKILWGKASKAEDRRHRSSRQCLVSVNGDRDYRTFARSPQIMMAATDMGEPETGALERRDDILAACTRQTGQAIATSTSTSSVSDAAAGISMPSFPAASM